jgi:hypothetical protein
MSIAAPGYGQQRSQEPTMTIEKPNLSTEEIYQQLRRGLGHEHVTDDNVFALIERAERDGHSILATELREWQAPCGGTDASNRESPRRGS